jgi:hypothetical protein
MIYEPTQIITSCLHWRARRLTFKAGQDKERTTEGQQTYPKDPYITLPDRKNELITVGQLPVGSRAPVAFGAKLVE